MEKNIKIKINDKEYSIIYTKVGDRYDVIVNEDDLLGIIPNAFFIKNNQANFLITSDKTMKIFAIIVKAINENERNYYQ